MSAEAKVRRGVAAVSLGAAAATPLAAQAQAQGAADAWQFRASIYGYFPTVCSSSEFRTGASGPTIDDDAGGILEALKFTFMGTFDAQKGRWGVFTDIISLDLGGTKRESRDFTLGGAGVPAGVTADLGMDLKSWVWTIAGRTPAIGGEPVECPDMAEAVWKRICGARFGALSAVATARIVGAVSSSVLAGRGYGSYRKE